MATLDLEIVTPKGRALKEAVDEVTAPSVDGEFGVLPGHVPLVAALRAGIVSYRLGADIKRCAVGAGFAEAGPTQVVILADEYVERGDIDPVLVRKELAEVQTEIAKAEAAATDAEPGTVTARESLAVLILRENWLAAELELYGDPPPATMRPFEEYGPPAPDADADIPSDQPPS